jgi:hypothetical protein
MVFVSGKFYFLSDSNPTILNIKNYPLVCGGHTSGNKRFPIQKRIPIPKYQMNHVEDSVKLVTNLMYSYTSKFRSNIAYNV